MLLKPATEDFRAIGYALGRVVLVVAAAGLVPLTWAILQREWKPLGGIVLMIGLAALFGASSELLRPEKSKLSWSHGMVVVALTWLVIPALGSIPLWLSGHFGRYLDAYFDAMSGLTTTGLSLLQDVDHLAESLNIWRHTLQFLGGQGIVLAALTFFAGSGILSLYHGEGRDDQIFPSVTSTARFIWTVSLVHGVVGVAVLTTEGILQLGFEPQRAFFHAINVFMAAFDTGGFTSMSSSIAYYGSAVFEATAAVLMLAGALSFGLHHALWRRTQGLLRNLEIRTILTTFAGTLTLTLLGLAIAGTYSDTASLTRRGFFQALSAHTGTGFSSVPTAELARWGGLTFIGISIAMALGGMASSTAGGVKSLRVGLTFASLVDTVREALLPERSVIATTFHQTRRQVLTQRLAKSVMAISLLYVATYLGGAAVGLAYGYPLTDALFESVSASAAVGLSVGVTQPGMPAVLEAVMVAQMWLGRLEFIAAFSLLGFFISWMVGE